MWCNRTNINSAKKVRESWHLWWHLDPEGIMRSEISQRRICTVWLIHIRHLERSSPETAEWWWPGAGWGVNEGYYLMGRAAVLERDKLLEMDGGDGRTGMNALNATEPYAFKWWRWEILGVFYQNFFFFKRKRQCFYQPHYRSLVQTFKYLFKWELSNKHSPVPKSCSQNSSRPEGHWDPQWLERARGR